MELPDPDGQEGTGQTTRPRRVDKKQKDGVVTVIAVPSDRNMKKKEYEELEKFQVSGPLGMTCLSSSFSLPFSHPAGSVTQLRCITSISSSLGLVYSRGSFPLIKQSLFNTLAEAPSSPDH